MRILALLILLVPIASFAQPQRINENDVLRGKFTEERVLKDFAAPMRSQGQFTIAPSHGLIWQTQKPFAVTTVITPAGLVQSVDGSETTRLSSDRMPFMMRLYTMLSGTLAGDWAPLEENFIATHGGTDKQWKLDLTPRNGDDPTLPFTGIHVTGGRFVERVVMDKRDGESDTLIFTRQAVTPQPLKADELATFTAANK